MIQEHGADQPQQINAWGTIARRHWTNRNDVQCSHVEKRLKYKSKNPWKQGPQRCAQNRAHCDQKNDPLEAAQWHLIKCNEVSHRHHNCKNQSPEGSR